MANNDVCLKCDRKWRNFLQNFLNQISGPPRRSPLVPHSDINRITKAVCTCATNQHPAWQDIKRDKINEAHEVYKQFSTFKTSVHAHKCFYDRLCNGMLFQNPNRITSADRLVYILYCKIQRQTGVPQNDILQNICPRRECPTTGVVHLGSLKQSHCGRFIGKSGTGIREAIHGIPVGNITINFGESNGDTITARATFNCQRRHIESVENGLRTRLEYYQTDEPIPLRDRRNRGLGRHTLGAHPDMETNLPVATDTNRPVTTDTNPPVTTDTNPPIAMDTDPSVEDQQG